MGSTRTKVGVVQLNSGKDVAANLARTDELVSDCVSDGARLIVLPECFAYLGPEEGKHAIAEQLPEGGPILARAAVWARDFGTELVLGGFWELAPDGKRVRNACVVLRADGTVASIYRKIHLFDVDLPDGTQLKESETIEPGSEVVVAQTVAGPLGLSICYDVRFPELYRALVDRGARVLAVPAAFTLTTGKDHWHVLLRARAIESQCFVLAAAQVGRHYGTRVSYGHALIVDPWGCVIAECGEGEGWTAAYLDPEVVDRVRAAVPSLRHRRLGVSPPGGI